MASTRKVSQCSTKARDGLEYGSLQFPSISNSDAMLQYALYTIEAVEFHHSCASPLRLPNSVFSLPTPIYPSPLDGCSLSCSHAMSLVRSTQIVVVVGDIYAFPPKKNLRMRYRTITTPMIIPESLKIATLLPEAAMRPRRLAEPFRFVLMEEKVSFCELH